MAERRKRDRFFFSSTVHIVCILGLEIYVKTKTPKSGQFQVKVKPANPNVMFDYEFSEEISEVLKKMDIDVHNCRGVRGQLVEINLYNQEDIPKVKNISYIYHTFQSS